jgi:hypothetical protein
MFTKRDFKAYWHAWLGTYLLLFISYTIAVYAQNLLYLVLPLLVTVVVLNDFLNDFYIMRKLKTNPVEL